MPRRSSPRLLHRAEPRFWSGSILNQDPGRGAGPVGHDTGTGWIPSLPHPRVHEECREEISVTDLQAVDGPGPVPILGEGAQDVPVDCP